ncbi:MAG: LysM peptidoglycan-binding domain-containing protein [Oligoflexales bacterium]|nr:LysM peptidoglycan-binding domain-containing protein [Oligoflexales bacterium]
MCDRIVIFILFFFCIDIAFSDDFVEKAKNLGARKNLSIGEAPEEYVVAPGDTLFDICDQLLDDPEYWPKLWSMNPFIKNPHFIWPGMRLRFYAGDEEVPPSLKIVEEEIVPVEKNVIDLPQLLADDLIDTENTMKKGGSDFVDFDTFPVGDEYFLEKDTRREYNSIQLMIPGLIEKNSRPQLGVVLSGPDGQSVLESRILVKLDKVVNLKTMYTVLRYGSEIYDSETGDFKGDLYFLIASATVQEINDKSSLAILDLDKQTKPVEKGDFLVDFIPMIKELKFDKKVALSALVSPGHVVSFDHAGKQFSGEGSMFFLDRGTLDGVAVGQRFHLSGHRYVEALPEFHKPDLSDHIIGEVEIIDATETGAVAYVLSAKTEYQMEDYVGKNPPLLSKLY